MGYFVVALSQQFSDQDKSLRNDESVGVTVSSVDGYKGTVGLTYSAVTNMPPPDYISPTSDSVYVPKNGSVIRYFTVGVPSGATVIVRAVGMDNNFNSDSDDITLTG